MTKKTKKVESFIFKGIITGTSNKVSDEFKNDNPRKTCYIKVDPQNENILLENGLTKYTSKEDKEDFFILKFSENLTIWCGQASTKMSVSIETNNFYTDKEINFACIKGKNKGNEYIRIYAVGVDSFDDIVITEETNPFEDIDGFEISPDDIAF